ncbi:MAG TPA: hypothetical protein VM870_01565, partial [Pyrinomonadaceae bacterium]|nr:hypothetical protein [Pyrinomonadaceae bacterium]
MKINYITKLNSVNSLEKIQALNALGVFTVRDMAEYAPCRQAALLLSCLQQGNLEEAEPEHYLEADALTEDNLARLGELDVAQLNSVGAAEAEQFGLVFNVSTLAQLAVFAPYLEAQQAVLESIRGAFDEKPSAPAALLPKLIGSTHTQARFSNYVREREVLLSDYQLTYFSDADEPAPNPLLIDIFYRGRCKFYLGYLASIHQKWVSDGTHLGEPVHSLALAPGESRNVAVLEWFRRQSSSRDEDTTGAERLRAEFTQTRALNEVVQTTAREHLSGSTEVDSSTATTGAGLVGGYGKGNAAGGAGAADLGALLGLGLP